MYAPYPPIACFNIIYNRLEIANFSTIRLNAVCILQTIESDSSKQWANGVSKEQWRSDFNRKLNTIHLTLAHSDLNVGNKDSIAPNWNNMKHYYDIDWLAVECNACAVQCIGVNQNHKYACKWECT